MDEMNTNMELDFRTRTAILTSNPEGVAILGAWDCMKTLAQEDPEGCVRLMPGLSMDMAALAGFLRCPEALVEKTVSIFAKLRRLTVKDGVIRLLSCKEEHDNASGSSVSEEALARKREQWRIRQANRRARLKQAEASGSGNTVTKRDRCDQRDSQRDMRDTTYDLRDNQRDSCDTMYDQRDLHDIALQSRTKTAVTPMRDRRDSQRDRRDNTAMYNRNVDSLHPLHASQAHKPVSPYDQFIPRNELSEEDRNVIDTWNRLPLPKYKGLFPDLRDKLHYLLKHYGEATLCKTIAGIANNAFLLGKKFGKTWSVSLGWLLEPEHFANVLAGKYREGKYDSGCGNAWHPGERLPFYLPGEGETRFTPEEQEQAIRDLYIPTTPAQLKAARLVGLPGFREETA
ncbi:MAG: hypothetical protein IKM73_07585 [Acidaminococcaceae bacterium]|nr:hypothetical protein [Acidaminococcaceae bacterium]